MPNLKPNYTVISVLGDSIANGYFDHNNTGWVSRLIQLLQKEKPYGFYALNFAASGDIIPNCQARYSNLVSNNSCDVLIIACGVNDIARWGTRKSNPSLSLSLRKDCWTNLLSAAKRDFKHVYVLQILPVDESKIPARQNEKGEDQFYTNDDIDDYNEILRNLCHNAPCCFLDLTAMLQAVGWSNCLFDDVHPNEKGHALIAQTVFDKIKGDIL